MSNRKRLRRYMADGVTLNPYAHRGGTPLGKIRQGGMGRRPAAPPQQQVLPAGLVRRFMAQHSRGDR